MFQLLSGLTDTDVTSRLVNYIIRHRLSSISPGIRPLAYRGYRGISCTTLRPGTTMSTATRRISWTEPIMRRDVTKTNTGIRRKSDKGAVSGLYQFTETLGYGDCKLPRVCRCVKQKKLRKGNFSSCAARSAIVIYDS